MCESVANTLSHEPYARQYARGRPSDSLELLRLAQTLPLGLEINGGEPTVFCLGTCLSPHLAGVQFEWREDLSVAIVAVGRMLPRFTHGSTTTAL